MVLKNFKVDGDACIRCGLCVSDCVCAIIEMGEIPFIKPVNLEKCIFCGHCQAICPTGAITLNDIECGNLTPAVKPLETDKITNVLKNRRSVRQYFNEAVEKAILEKVIDVSAWAPTAKNIRDIGFVIFNGRQKVETLMYACADVMEQFNILPEVAAAIRKDKDVLFRGAPCVVAVYASDRPYAVSDCATILAAIELSLPSFGLASCWAGLFTTTCSKAVPATLLLPENKKILGGLMIGKPKIHYKRIPYRPIPLLQWV